MYASPSPASTRVKRHVEFLSTLYVAWGAIFALVAVAGFALAGGAFAIAESTGPVRFSSEMAARLTGINVDGEMRSVNTDVAKADSDESGLNTGEKTAVGAAAGAVVGAVTGAGVLEGAVVGAGGGLAWGLLSEQGREVPDDTPLRFSLEEKLDL